MTYYVYILASKRNGTLYIGVTNDLGKRVHAHKNDIIKGFTSKYSIHLLVYYETFENINDALLREKRLKKWNRKWKLELIEKVNPDWKDLFFDLLVLRYFVWVIFFNIRESVIPVQTVIQTKSIIDWTPAFECVQ